MKLIGKGNIEKRGKNSWRLRVTVAQSGSSKNPQRLSKTVTVRNKTEAGLLLDEWKFELMQETAVIDSRTLTVSSYLADYLKYCQEDKQLSASTIQGYRAIIENRISPRLGDEKLRDLTPYAIENFYRELKASGGLNGRSLSGATCQRVHSLLKTALRRAVYLGHINVNPCDVLRGPRVDYRESSVLCEAEVVRMIELLKGHPQRNFAIATTLAVSTGMRRGEVCGLTWKNVDFATAAITVAQSLLEVGKDDTVNGNTLVVKEPKTARSRRKIALDEGTLALLKDARNEQQLRLAYYGIVQTDNTSVCANIKGDWYRPDNFTSDFIQFRDEQGFEIRLHDLRHTHATLLLKHGEDLAAVSKRLGHTTASTTLNFYTHVLPGMDEGVATRFAGILNSCKPDSDKPILGRINSRVPTVPQEAKIGAGKQRSQNA